MGAFSDEHVSFRLLQMDPVHRKAYLDMWGRINDVEPVRRTVILQTVMPGLYAVDKWDKASTFKIDTQTIIRGYWPHIVKLPEQILECRKVFIIEIMENEGPALLRLEEAYKVNVSVWDHPQILTRLVTGQWYPLRTQHAVIEVQKAGNLGKCSLYCGSGPYDFDTAHLSLWATNVCPTIDTHGINIFGLPYVIFSCKEVAALYAESLQKEVELRITQQHHFHWR